VRRLQLSFSLLLALVCLSGAALAQSDFPRLQPGDPPRAQLITVEPANEAGEVVINGAQNAVFPTAQVAIRNLYTGDAVYTQAGITGSFSARLYGPGNTPFLISPVQGNIPDAVRDRPGSLPGGPATIVWGALPEAEGDGVRFTLSGALGSERWAARGLINQTTFNPDDPQQLELSLDITVPAPQIDLSGVRYIATLELLPIAVLRDGVLAPVGSVASNNGWSGVLTPSGLAIDDLAATIPLGEVVANSSDLTPVLEGLSFTFDFEIRLSASLPPGLYVPLLRPRIRNGEMLPEPLFANSVYGISETSDAALARLPLVLNVGEVSDVPLTAALMIDTPSDGGRGILPEDSAGLALSNRVRFNPLTYIVPLNAPTGDPATYSLEPALPQMLANSYFTSEPPLIPFGAEAGSLDVTVTAPDGTRNPTGERAILQASIGSDATDERARFGVQSPVDLYAITTFEPSLMRYSFEQYGEYIVSATAELRDVFDNTYTIGGDYRIVVAELLDMTPAALPGTPFELGNALNAGLRIAPSAPADVTVRVVVFPLDGSAPQETLLEGQATSHGIFQPDAPVVFETPGEYLIEYEARYTDAEGRLWAGSLRSAGVIASGERGYAARGERGFSSPELPAPQAWYSAERVLANAGLDVQDETLVVRMPYHTGDVLWIEDDIARSVDPRLSLYDVTGNYAVWLINGATTDASPFGDALRERVGLLELPVALLAADADPYDPALNTPDAAVNEGYRYVTIARPNVTMRQMVLGSVEPTLPTWVDMDDPLNQQIGAGFAGVQPGDYFFMFGGAVLHNDELGVQNSSIYASVGVVLDSDAEPGTRIAPPARGADGAADFGALFTLPNDSYDAFFVPTGVQAGDVFTVGERVALSGQAAPALPVTVGVTITSPSGAQRQTFGRANAVGYYYDPAQDFVVDEVGVWTVDVQVLVDAQTSAGQPQSPFPMGGVPGSASGRYLFYVVDDASELLPRETRADLSIPSALPYNFSFTLPQGWVGESISYTLRTDGYVVEQGDLRFSGRTFSYQHNPTNINRRFPNIEVEAREDGASASDAERVTFYVRATDENGAQRVLYRVYHFFHDRLISLDEGEAQ
jgi:hypothetical protein